MATASRKHYTRDDVLAISNRPKPDLVEGRLIERNPMGQEADYVIGTIHAILRAFAKSSLLGLVNGPGCGYQIFPNSERIRFSVVSFTRLERVPGGKPAKEFSQTVPDLAVEVISPRDRIEKVNAHLKDFREVGVPLIGIVHVAQREVHVMRSDGSTLLRSASDTLDGDPSLPGFPCPVADFFE